MTINYVDNATQYGTSYEPAGQLLYLSSNKFITADLATTNSLRVRVFDAFGNSGGTVTKAGTEAIASFYMVRLSSTSVWLGWVDQTVPDPTSFPGHKFYSSLLTISGNSVSSSGNILTEGSFDRVGIYGGWNTSTSGCVVYYFVRNTLGSFTLRSRQFSGATPGSFTNVFGLSDSYYGFRITKFNSGRGLMLWDNGVNGVASLVTDGGQVITSPGVSGRMFIDYPGVRSGNLVVAGYASSLSTPYTAEFVSVVLTGNKDLSIVSGTITELSVNEAPDLQFGRISKDDTTAYLVGFYTSQSNNGVKAIFMNFDLDSGVASTPTIDDGLSPLGHNLTSVAHYGNNPITVRDSSDNAIFIYTGPGIPIQCIYYKGEGGLDDVSVPLNIYNILPDNMAYDNDNDRLVVGSGAPRRLHACLEGSQSGGFTSIVQGYPLDAVTRSISFSHDPLLEG